MPEVSKLLLVDDHPAIRSGLRRIMKGEPSLGPLIEAGTGQQALALVQSEKPAVVVLDLALPDIPAQELVRTILEMAPEVRVLLYSGLTENEVIVDSVMAGAHGFVPKSAGSDELLETLRAVAGGALCFRPPVADMVEHLIRTEQPSKLLTPREELVLKLMADSKTNGDIATELGITPSTTRDHVRRLFTKLGATDRSDAVRIARSRQIL